MLKSFKTGYVFSYTESGSHFCRTEIILHAFRIPTYWNFMSIFLHMHDATSNKESKDHFTLQSSWRFNSPVYIVCSWSETKSKDHFTLQSGWRYNSPTNTLCMLLKCSRIREEGFQNGQLRRMSRETKMIIYQPQFLKYVPPILNSTQHASCVVSEKCTTSVVQTDELDFDMVLWRKSMGFCDSVRRFQNLRDCTIF